MVSIPVSYIQVAGPLCLVSAAPYYDRDKCLSVYLLTSDRASDRCRFRLFIKSVRPVPVILRKAAFCQYLFYIPVVSVVILLITVRAECKAETHCSEALVVQIRVIVKI